MLLIPKNNLLVLTLSLLSVVTTLAQDVVYARSIVSDLASEKYHGRGYVKNGDAKAANFIAKQFKKDGLDMFEGSYFQKYMFPINTFPSTIKVSIDGHELTPGEDYVVSLSAKSVNNEFEIKNYRGQ